MSNNQANTRFLTFDGYLGAIGAFMQEFQGQEEEEKKD